MSEIHRAAGVISAAYFIHGRANFFRAQKGGRRIADALDNAAEALKGMAVSIREKHDAKALADGERK